MSDVENDLQSRVDSFVNELTALIRRQALQAVEEVLKKGETITAPTARRVGRPPKAATVAAAAAAEDRRPTAKAAAKPSTSKAPAAAKRRAGEKRTPQQLSQITEQVYNYIKSNGNQGVEQIAKTLATSTKELTLPIRKLLGEKKISSKGQKRATRYSAR